MPNLKPDSGIPRYGTLWWNELHSLADMVRQQRYSDHSLKNIDGGPRTSCYLLAKGKHKKALIVGKDWVASGREDPLKTAYQALEKLGEVQPGQAIGLDKFYRFHRQDGSFISVFEAEYVNDPCQFRFDTPEDSENLVNGIAPIASRYDQKIVGAFLGLMFSHYRSLDGHLPVFALDGGDVMGGLQENRTYRFVFLWCDRLQKVPREELAAFLIERIAPPKLFSGTLLHGRQPEFVRLINERVLRDSAKLR